jgi:stalled ribosome alternative rescue factor ArfA
MRDSFTFHRSYYDALKEVDMAITAQLLNAIFQYVFEEVREPQLTGVAKALWVLIEPQLKADTARYENGRKGGAPKGNQNATKNNQKTTEKQPNDNQTTTMVESRLFKEKEEKNKERKEAKEIKKEEKDNERYDNNNNNNNACACEGKKKTFAEWFNGALDFYESSIPRIQKMTPKRKAMIQGILDKGYTYEDIGKAVKNAAISMRLNGRERVNGKTPYKTDFDYIFNEDNFLKILEGKYN